MAKTSNKSLKLRGKQTTTSTTSGIFRITRTAIDAEKYKVAKRKNLAKRHSGFGSHPSGNDLPRTKAGKHPTTMHRTATLKRRQSNSKRESLADKRVANPKFQPGQTHKAHGIPDILGGPNTQSNLVNEGRTGNLSAHKKVENAIRRDIDDRKSRSDTSVHKRRGSMEMTEEFSASGESMKRVYHAHIDAGNGTERFDRYTVTKRRRRK